MNKSFFNGVTIVAALCCFLLAGSALAVKAPDSPATLQRITVKKVQELQSKGETILFIDTRRGGQWDRAKDKIPGAIRLTGRSDLMPFKETTPPDRVIVTYCT